MSHQHVLTVYRIDSSKGTAGRKSHSVIKCLYPFNIRL